jgi:hypothetical protein
MSCICAGTRCAHACGVYSFVYLDVGTQVLIIAQPPVAGLKEATGIDGIAKSRAWTCCNICETLPTLVAYTTLYLTGWLMQFNCVSDDDILCQWRWYSWYMWPAYLQIRWTCNQDGCQHVSATTRIWCCCWKITDLSQISWMIHGAWH